MQFEVPITMCIQ